MSNDLKYTSENLFDIKCLRNNIHQQYQECCVQHRILDAKMEKLQEIGDALDRHILSIEKENKND